MAGGLGKGYFPFTDCPNMLKWDKPILEIILLGVFLMD